MPPPPLPPPLGWTHTFPPRPMEGGWPLPPPVPYLEGGQGPEGCDLEGGAGDGGGERGEGHPQALQLVDEAVEVGGVRRLVRRVWRWKVASRSHSGLTLSANVPQLKFSENPIKTRSD